ncbi:helix-turn-helix transcriptional regulator [Streptomyces sp. NPDC026672]|uniref:helix-turn-helix transcriptional regulator n=1 Tax=unclassified Streptomyces TaxID=2593676 RepID=UPI0033FB355D
MNTELRDFLQSRRARLTPGEVGLPERGRRRVAGLRREEVAQLAGVSTDYYVRLEQGRGPHVSDQVLDAVGRALRLEPTELAHLYALARPPRRRAAPRGPRPVRRSLRLMLDGMAGPALISDYTTTVLAANELARAVFGFDDRSRDRARHFFLAPAARDFYPNWAEDAHTLVAELRLQTGRRPDDPRLTALVGELSIKSDEFRELWAKHPVRQKTAGRKTLLHPDVGLLELSYDRMTLADDNDAQLYVYTVEPGSESAERLALLASWHATAPESPAIGADRP